MGIKERRIKEKEDLKNNILVEAKRIAREQGWQQVTIRKIADAIEYSIPTIYEYFDSKDDLFNELRLQGYQLLCEMLEARLAEVISPHDILLTVAHVYWNFAWEYRELFELMHSIDFTQPDDINLLMPYIIKIRTIVQQALSALLNTEISPTLMRDKLDTTRCIMHGFITIALGGSIKKERAKKLMLKALDESISVWLD